MTLHDERGGLTCGGSCAAPDIHSLIRPPSPARTLLNTTLSARGAAARLGQPWAMRACLRLGEVTTCSKRREQAERQQQWRASGALSFVLQHIDGSSQWWWRYCQQKPAADTTEPGP